MTALLIFVSSFAVVFLLGLQQINVERRSVLAAATTSPLIGIASLVQFKLLPGPTTALDVAGFLLGGSAGIAVGMLAHPWLVQLSRRVFDCAADDTPPHVPEIGTDASRLAIEIADEAARSEIEVECTARRLAGVTWYDTRLPRQDDPCYQPDIDRALSYLLHRERVLVHPVQMHLVRFGR